jgi:hypothetical protein
MQRQIVLNNIEYIKVSSNFGCIISSKDLLLINVNTSGFEQLSNKPGGFFFFTLLF